MQKVSEQFYVDKTKQLGKGNFGVVYKGYMLTENKIIAVKYMNEIMLNKNPDYERQIAVMQDLSKINHPNIMGYYGYQMGKDGLYCFVQFCSGGTLKDLVKKKISQIKILTIFRQMLEAMTYINKLNKVHRDLKPDNILLDENLQLKIADFGLARDVQIQMTKGACTPLFAAPEVFNLDSYDQKCDVWSAGLILYEMLTGKQMFSHIKTKVELKQQLNKFKKGQRKIVYPKQLHKQWTTLTQKMLTHDKGKRPSFGDLLKYFDSVSDQIQNDLNVKYGFDPSNLNDIRSSIMRSQHINPYSSQQGKGKMDPIQKLKQQKSFTKFTNVQKYLIFFRMKTDFLNKIIKAFTSNQYAVLKNVYKYILMFLSVSCYISKLSYNLMQLKNKLIPTPDGIVSTADLQQQHIKQWQQLLNQYKSKHATNIQKFRSVLDKQIIQKITGSYLKRDQQKKIIQSYKNLMTWIQQSGKGNFQKQSVYMDLFVQIMNEKDTYCTQQQLKSMSQTDVKTYSYIRLAGHLDQFMPDKQYKNEDFIRIKRQQLQNMTKADVIEFIIKFNKK